MLALQKTLNFDIIRMNEFIIFYVSVTNFIVYLLINKMLS